MTQTITGKITKGKGLTGTLSPTQIKIYPETSSLTVTPTEEQQTFTPEQNTYYDSVTVNGFHVPTEEVTVTATSDTQTIYPTENKYINKVTVNPTFTPTETLTITENGTYDVTNYASAEVETETLTEDDYFSNAMVLNAYTNCGVQHIIKKLPTVYINSTDSCRYLFSGCNLLENLVIRTTLGGVSSSNMERMFASCSSLKTLDLKPLRSSGNLSYTFAGCSSLELLDVRNFNFVNASLYTQCFMSVPSNCKIIVMDNTQKDWVLARRSDFTNVVTVDELENE